MFDDNHERITPAQKLEQGKGKSLAWLGFVLSIGSGFCMACMSLFVKLAASLPFYEMLLARSVGILIFCPPVMIYYLQDFVPSNKNDFFVVTSRGILGCAAVGGLYFSIRHIPLADATAILFTSPVWTSIFGFIILRERWSVYDSFGTILCVVGVTLITQPTFIFHLGKKSVERHSEWIAYTVSFLSSISISLSFICVRKAKQAGPFTLVFYFGVMGILLGTFVGLAAGEGFQLPQCGTLDILYTLMSAVFSFFGQVCLVFALKLEKVSVVALGKTTDIFFVFIFEIVFIRSAVNWLCVIGGLLVMCSNVTVLVKKLFDGDTASA